MDDLAAQFDETRARLGELSEREELAGLAGLAEITSGLDALLGQLADEQPEEEAERARLEILLRGLRAVADHFAPPHQESDAEKEALPSPPSTANQGLRQFIAAFRDETRKRLGGLSISMMGMFNEQASDQELDRSAQHLHAIRGSAAMLGLGPVADVSGLMEQVLIKMRKLDPAERVWPTKALMSGYRLLEQAVDDPDAHVEDELAEQVTHELRECFEDLVGSTTLEELSDVTEARAQRADAHTDTPRDTHDDFADLAREAPADQPHDEAPAQDLGELTHTTSLEGMEQRILIVDDVDTIAASIGFVLSELDLPIDIASNGEEALGMLRDRPYSLIISDIDMPRMDGVALTRMVRADDTLSDIPIILLTALDHPSERDVGIDAGANDYIIKGSIGGGELVNRVRDLLKIAPFVPAEAQRRRRRKRVLVAEDAETVAASIAFLLSEGDYDIVLTSNGHEALTRLEREDFDLLISDWQMPQMSGYELTRAVRVSAHIKQLPIVLLTSLSSDKVRQDAREAGADRFLVKGEIAGGRLLSIVEELIADAAT